MQPNFLLRKIVERHIGPEVANRSKHGFSAPLLATPGVRAQLPFEETIGDNSIFEGQPFAPSAREVVLHQRFSVFKWPYFALARTYFLLRFGSYNVASLIV